MNKLAWTLLFIVFITITVYSGNGSGVDHPPCWEAGTDRPPPGLPDRFLYCLVLQYCLEFTLFIIMILAKKNISDCFFCFNEGL
jgi:hypothetical protein